MIRAPEQDDAEPVPQVVSICRSMSGRSARLSSGSRYARPLSAKTSPSLVNEARTVCGVSATVGHDALPIAFTTDEGRTSIIGKKIASSFCRACLT